MTAHIMLIIALVSVVQSLFGAGVLLFGTPLLLFLGHDFIEVLFLLLPISIAINLLQIVQHRQLIDFVFYRKVLLLTLPAIALFLFLVTHVRINIGLIVGVFLLFIALKEFSVAAANGINRLMRYETAYFIVMGIVHGVSNLGGALLTALVHHKEYPKDVARVTVAACYATFAAIQLLTLKLFSPQPLQLFGYDHFIYLVVGCLIFVYVDAVFYAQVAREKYQRMFSMFIAFSGTLLILKTLT